MHEEDKLKRAIILKVGELQAAMGEYVAKAKMTPDTMSYMNQLLFHTQLLTKKVKGI